VATAVATIFLARPTGEFVARNAAQQTNRREADVRISVLTTGIDDVKIE
jgi:hypothetical protein